MRYISKFKVQQSLFLTLLVFAAALFSSQLLAQGVGENSYDSNSGNKRSLMESDRESRFERYQGSSGRSSSSLGDAIKRARAIQPGEVLGARRSRDANNQPIYVVKILTKSGVVKKVRIKAKD